MAKSLAAHKDEVRALFDRVDKNGDGDISYLEFKQAISNKSIKWGSLDFAKHLPGVAAFGELDDSGDKRVQFDEFWDKAVENCNYYM